MSRNSFLSFALSMILVAVGLAASFMPAASASELLTRARRTLGALPKNMETAEFPVTLERVELGSYWPAHLDRCGRLCIGWVVHVSLSTNELGLG